MGVGELRDEVGGEAVAFFAYLEGETMRIYGAPGANSRVFDPRFAAQHERKYRVNLLRRHGAIAIAYKSREKMFCYGPCHFVSIDFPQEIPVVCRGGRNSEKWVFRVMRNAQSE